MHENRIRRIRHHGVMILRAIGLLLIGGGLLSWSWNVSISELFGMPQMTFRQAVATGLFIGIVFAITGSAARLRHHRPECPGRGDAS
jgi:hypothetical protein